MGKFKYLILGSGVGEAIAYLLLQFKDTLVVNLTDEDGTKARNIAVRLSKLTGRCCTSREFHAETDMDSLGCHMYDVIISALPAKFSPQLAKLAIKNKVSFCDLGGVMEVTTQIFKLNVGPDCNFSIVSDCGLMPGLGMMLCASIVNDFNCTDSLSILVGGIPQRPQPPIDYQRVYSVEGMKHLCYDEAPILSDGQIIEVAPFSNYEKLVVPELANYVNKTGEIETFMTAGTARAHWSFRARGVKNFSEKTVRWPGFMDFVKDIPREKFEEVITPLISIPVDAVNPDMVWMRVTGTGQKNGQPAEHSYTLVDKFDEKTGLSAMKRTTGFATAILAHMMAQGRVLRGINTSESCLDPDHLKQYIKELMLYLPGLKEN